MKLNNITANLSETEIATILKDAIELQTGMKVDNISFNVSMRSTGYGMAERDEPYFGGAVVNFAKGQELKG